MIKINAYIDESGDPHFNEKSSKNIVYSCILVESKNVDDVSDKLKLIQKKYGLNEFKSSKISSEDRRYEILSDLSKVDIKHLSLLVDKNKVIGDWKKYPKSFYKFTQKLLHRQLHQLFNNVNVTVDKYGTEEYQQSFKKYIEREMQLNLFESNFEIGSAKDSIIIQVADFYGGTRRKLAENDFESPERFQSIMNNQNLYHFQWPDNYENLYLENINDELDKKVARICVECAETYLQHNMDDLNNKAKVLTIEYLLMNVKHVKPYDYIYTDELLSWLSNNKIKYSVEEYRTKVLAELRDENVIIGGSRKGLKIPITMNELIEHINFNANMYMSIMKRTKNIIEIFKAKSLGEIDLLNEKTFHIHKKLFESI
jgi:hypothetical protein